MVSLPMRRTAIRAREVGGRSFSLRKLVIELGMKDEEMVEEVEEEFVSSSEEVELSEGEKFEEWKRRAEAIMELREAREDFGKVCKYCTTCSRDA